MRYLRFIPFILLNLFLSITSCQSQIEKGIKISYNTTPLPGVFIKNYNLNALNDGKISNYPSFWLDKNVYGWFKQKIVKIYITPKEKFKNSILLNLHVPRINKNMLPPSRIDIYRSVNGHSDYLGDMKKENLGTSEGYNYNLIINKNFDSLVAVIKPDGAYVFCDEITLSKMADLASNVNVKNDALSVDKQYQVLINENDSNKLAENIAIQFSKSFGVNNMNLLTKSSFATTERKNIKTLSNFVRTKKYLSHKYLNYLNSLNVNGIFKSNSSIIIPCYPFSQITTIYPKISQIIDRNLTVSSLNNGKGYKMFMIQNTTNKDLTVELPLASNLFNYVYFRVGDATSKNYNLIPDVLYPLKNNFKISPGDKEFIFIKFVAKKRGLEITNLNFKINNSEIIKVPIKEVVSAKLFNKDESLNAINWAYFNYPGLTGKTNIVRKDLNEHYINTFVVPSAYLPKLSTPNNQTLFVKYLNYCSGAKNLLLFLNLNKNDIIKNYNNKAFLIKLKNWIEAVYLTSFKNGFKNIYIYLLDETPSDAASYYKKIIVELKEIISKNVKFYGTVTNNIKVFDELNGSLDVIQTMDEVIKSDKKSNNNNVWIYHTKSPSKELSPNDNFRMLAWKAYVYDLGGIGFWNYADVRKDLSGKINTLNDFGSTPGYNVIYFDNKNQLLSSRRWEAFSRGIEEYEILESSKLNKNDLLNKIINSNESNSRDSIMNNIIFNACK